MQASFSERSAATMIGIHHDGWRESDRFLNSAVDDSPREHDFRFQNKKRNDFKSAVF
jgi:hypothetical protein